MVASPELTGRPAVSSEGARQCRGPSLSGTEEVALVCFSCGRSSHGVSRCPRIDAEFPFFYQDGRWNTGTDNIDLFGGRRHREDSSRETMTNPGRGVSLPDP